MGRVGGRLPARPFSQEVGGYLDIQPVSNFRAAADARMDELRTMGLPAPLLRAAEAIGVDAFLAFWRIIDQEQAYRADNGNIELKMRSYRSYLRFQRNRYIEQLATTGMPPAEIQNAVRLNLCEQISLRHIYRVGAKK